MAALGITRQAVWQPCSHTFCCCQYAAMRAQRFSYRRFPIFAGASWQQFMKPRQCTESNRRFLLTEAVVIAAWAGCFDRSREKKNVSKSSFYLLESFSFSSNPYLSSKSYRFLSENLYFSLKVYGFLRNSIIFLRQSMLVQRIIFYRTSVFVFDAKLFLLSYFSLPPKYYWCCVVVLMRQRTA